METILKGEITNGCTCTEYDEATGEYTDEPADICYGDCWEQAVEDFTNVTEELRKANETDYWKVENIRLWHGNVSGYFHAKDVASLIEGMTVNGMWAMRYTVYSDRIEYSLSHHDALGSASVLRAVTEEEYEEVRW